LKDGSCEQNAGHLYIASCGWTLIDNAAICVYDLPIEVTARAGDVGVDDVLYIDIEVFVREGCA
jgi:hypothetical protein